MGKRLGAAVAAFLLLSGCVHAPAKEETLHILATTYPMYLLTTSIVGSAEGVTVDLLVNSQTSCLHDYTLTVENMKAIEKADVIVMNGAGLEDFMSDALSQSDATVIDCSQSLELLPSLEEHGHGPEGHDHDEEWDPHYWMDPQLALEARQALFRSLSEWIGPVSFSSDCMQSEPEEVMGELPCPYLITFHDGFQYFAQAYGLTLLKAIEEEEGSTASAQEIKETIALIQEYHIPAIFVEKNGSRATAEVISRETGCAVYALDMLMSGEALGIQPYFEAINTNVEVVREALS